MTQQQTERIDGKAIAAEVLEICRQRCAEFKGRGGPPSLAVVRVGEDPASRVYVRGKLRAAAKVGIQASEHHLEATATQQEVEATVRALAADDAVDGILVQLPLPRHLHEGAILGLVPTDKDVDGFGVESLGALVAGLPGLRACTPAGVMTLLDHAFAARGETLRGKRALVIGRSRIVGKPMALLLLAADATVTIAHSKSADLAAEVGRADVVVAAAGVPHLVRGEWLAPGAVVIDVGIHRRDDGSLCGDVDTDSAEGIAAAITPVPGGVGPMTIATLMRNTVEAAVRRRGESADV
ncbi:MAG: bifunctional 5,10-methylenetetrahydrofolate dehydrogenase/5,10-methenyltetrahydrofolate cyclohydrolase [Deltaproteobacteria bacterium]|nr:bifunctional 5,10-methylenetetrahydrofolate dehydrogenase/5,10-methenyltetrahydrofolate cyclohydrolase [Deltaproteobacteria bacterium]